MSKNGITNAGSQQLKLGIKDNSRGGTVERSDAVPQHCPLVFSWGQKGPTERVLGGASDFIPLYGSETFNGSSKFATHQTPFAQLFHNTANRYLFQRLVPDDIGPESNVRIFLDVWQGNINNYARNSDGSIATDPITDEPIIDSTTPLVPGVKLRWLAKVLTAGMETSTATIEAGTITSGGTTSNMYPFMDVPAKFLGEAYNNSGFIIESILNKDKDTNLVNKLKSLLYRLYYVKRPDAKSSHTLKENIYQSVFSTFTLNGAVSKDNKKAYTLQNASNTWENEDDTRYDIIYNEFEEMYLYEDNIDLLTTMFMNNEKTFISQIPKVWKNNVAAATFNWFDFLSEDDTVLVEEERYLMNILTGKSSKGVRYFTVEFDTSSTGITAGLSPVSFGIDTPIWLGGGSDGTLSNAKFEAAVQKELDKYLDYNSEVMDTAVNVETVIYDSGFEMATKEKLFYFIALRKNTFVSTCTFVNSMGRRLSTEEEYENAAILAIKASVFPESEHYATKACRAIITVGQGITDYVDYKGLLPQSFDIAYKTASYMGASDGKWVNGYDFSMGGDNAIIVLKDLTPKVIPNNVKEMLWDSQANWSQATTRKTYFFPAIQTVYPYDDSVLNSYFNIWIILDLQTIADKTWRKFTGNYRDTKAELSKKIVDYFKEQTAGRYDGFDGIIPEVQFTDEDNQRGYSWTLIVSVYNNVSRTVQTNAVFAYRAE